MQNHKALTFDIKVLPEFHLIKVHYRAILTRTTII